MSSTNGARRGRQLGTRCSNPPSYRLNKEGYVGTEQTIGKGNGSREQRNLNTDMAEDEVKRAGQAVE